MVGIIVWTLVLHIFSNGVLVRSSRILLIPGQLPEDIYPLHAIGETLMSRGHDVFTIISDKTDLESIYLPFGLQTLQYITPDDVESFTSESWSINQLSQLPLKEKQIQSAFKVLHTKHCTTILDDNNFMEILQESQFDIALVHGSALTRCHFIIAHAIHIPFVYISTHVEISVSRIPVMPSFVPHYDKPYTSRMSFKERVLNLIAYMKPEIEFWQDSALLKRYKSKIDSSVTEMHDLLRLSSLFVITTDNVIDWQTPEMPHLVHERALTAEVGKKNGKNQDCQIVHQLDAMSSSLKGVIVVLLGTAVDVYPKTVLEGILTLSKDYQLVVINEKLLVTLPFAWHAPYNTRNQVFAHENVKLVITPGNNEDQSESLYHGVPVFNIPLFGDDFHNTKRIIQRDVGAELILSTQKYTSEQIANAIRETLDNETFATNAQMMSTLMKAIPTHRWISILENIITFGDEHIRSVALDLPLSNYAMLDLMGILCLIAIITFSILSRIVMYFVGIVVTKIFFVIIKIMVGVIRLLYKIVTLGRGSKKTKQE